MHLYTKIRNFANSMKDIIIAAPIILGIIGGIVIVGLTFVSKSHVLHGYRKSLFIASMTAVFPGIFLICFILSVLASYSIQSAALNIRHMIRNTNSTAAESSQDDSSGGANLTKKEYCLLTLLISTAFIGAVGASMLLSSMFVLHISHEYLKIAVYACISPLLALCSLGVIGRIADVISNAIQTDYRVVGSALAQEIQLTDVQEIAPDTSHMVYETTV